MVLVLSILPLVACLHLRSDEDFYARMILQVFFGITLIEPPTLSDVYVFNTHAFAMVQG